MTSYQAAEAIRDSGVKVFVVAAGGAAGLQYLLWQPGGAGAALVGGAFPYAREEIADFMGYSPEKFVTEETALDQAAVAYIRAKAVAGWDKPAAGLAVTAALATSTERRGVDHAWGAVVSDLGVWTDHVTFGPDMGRVDQGRHAAEFGLGLLDFAVNLRVVQPSVRPAEWKLEELLWKRPIFLPNGQRTNELSRIPLFWTALPGSFNPPHAGHHYMAREVETKTSSAVVYTINQDSPHKEQLSVVDMLGRAASFRGVRYDEPRPVMFTRDQPLFIQKLAQFPRMIVGTDTLERMFDPQWGVRQGELLEAMRTRHARIFVFNRGKLFRDAIQIVPEGYRYLFTSMGDPPAISSTQIRAAHGFDT